MKLLKNRTVLGVLCIVVSLLICFAVTPLVNAGLSQKTTIVRFVKDVKMCIRDRSKTGKQKNNTMIWRKTDA